jgi:hypothetical protein
MSVFAAEEAVPRDSVPDDHLAWLGFQGPVKEVHEYNYGQYSKTVYRFDAKGRLLEYINYGSPFFGDGGCVFGLLEHYRYDYEKSGKIIFLETYNADNALVDEYADMILELFPPQDKEEKHFDKSEREFGDTTFCYSEWHNTEESFRYFGRRYDKHGNWIEDVNADEDDYYCANVRVREISYYRDIEVLGLPVGVKTVKNDWVADGKKWSNAYDFDREGNLRQFNSWCNKEPLYEWTPADTTVMAYDLLVSDITNNVKQKISYWK